MGLQRHKRAAILMLSGCWFHKGPSPLVWCEKLRHQQIWEIRRLNINEEGQWLKSRLVWQEYRCFNWIFNKRGMCFLTFGNVLIRGFCFIFLYCDIIQSNAWWQSWDTTSRIIKLPYSCIRQLSRHLSHSFSVYILKIFQKTIHT